MLLGGFRTNVGKDGVAKRSRRPRRTIQVAFETSKLVCYLLGLGLFLFSIKNMATNRLTR